jgi:hypothetical protein
MIPGMSKFVFLHDYLLFYFSIKRHVVSATRARYDSFSDRQVDNVSRILTSNLHTIIEINNK